VSVIGPAAGSLTSDLSSVASLSLSVLTVSQQVSAVDVSEGEQFVLLPCHFNKSELINATVVWTRQDLSPSTVHQRQTGGDELKDQNQLYRDRTSMKADSLETGDVSLSLSDLQLSDSGTYTCTVRDPRGEPRATDVELSRIPCLPARPPAQVAGISNLVLSPQWIKKYKHANRKIQTCK
uniref:Ig-like domain-containing protein n=1 Tax=Kryptolebias marmoratus TaxID=37003 RepID=A0A3Q3AZA7_KRYMA